MIRPNGPTNTPLPGGSIRSLRTNAAKTRICTTARFERFEPTRPKTESARRPDSSASNQRSQKQNLPGGAESSASNQRGQKQNLHDGPNRALPTNEARNRTRIEQFDPPQPRTEPIPRSESFAPEPAGPNADRVPRPQSSTRTYASTNTSRRTARIAPHAAAVSIKKPPRT